MNNELILARAALQLAKTNVEIDKAINRILELHGVERRKPQHIRNRTCRICGGEHPWQRCGND